MSLCCVCNKFEVDTPTCNVFGKPTIPQVYSLGDLDHEGRLLLRAGNWKPLISSGPICIVCKEHLLQCGKCHLKWDLLHLPVKCCFRVANLGPCHIESTHFCILCWNGFMSNVLIQVKALPEDLIPKSPNGSSKIKKNKYRERFNGGKKTPSLKKQTPNCNDEEEEQANEDFVTDKTNLLSGKREGEQKKLAALMNMILTTVSPNARAKIEAGFEEIELSSIFSSDASSGAAVTPSTDIKGQRTIYASICRNCLDSRPHQTCKGCDTIVLGRLHGDCFNH
jgi:hypothetical protein